MTRSNAHERHHPLQGVRSRLVAAGLLLACVTPLLSGCVWMRGFTTVGQLGVSVDAGGNPVIAVLACSEVRPKITMFDDGLKVASDSESDQHTERGRWVAGGGFSGIRTLSISAPDEVWAATLAPGRLERGRLFALEGFAVEDDFASLGGASFRVEDLADLRPDQVQVNGELVSWGTFGGYRCP